MHKSPMNPAALAGHRRSLRGWRRRATGPGILVLLVLACSGLLRGEVLKDRLVPRRFGVVVPGQIYRSGQISAPLVEKVLQQNSIKVIVHLNGPQAGLDGVAAEQRAVRKLGIDYYCYHLNGDGTGDIHQYVRALETIREAVTRSEPVLVHCAAGTQRTGAVLAAYHLLLEHGAPAEALADMKRYGWRPDHDRVLPQYVNSHMKELAELLVADGVLKQVPNPLPRLATR
jgi:protein-tyrosine phosphatase